MKKPSDPYTARKELYRAIEAGELSLSESVRRLRKLVGKTQPQFAELVGIAHRTLLDLEREKGNPTLDTLVKIGRPFGLVIGFRLGRREPKDQ